MTRTPKKSHNRFMLLVDMGTFMRPFIWLCLAGVLFSHRIPQEKIYILAMGDSITQGGKRNQQEYTYRLPLQKLLHNHGVDYDFIGSRQSGLHDDANWPEVAKGIPFDPDHEGYYGNTTRAVVEKVSKAMEGYERFPDIVLIHLGTNDQKAGNFEETIVAPLTTFIGLLRQKNPHVVVLLGHLNFNGGEALEIRRLVESLSADLDTAESPVKTVHHYRGWIENPEDVYTDTFDWAHPNLKGQEKMARQWFEALKPYLE